MSALLPDALAAALLVALVAYAVLGGADFGGGVWDLLARGPRKQAQRALIESAIAPVWEANHVWLIVAVVVLFSAFPPAFGAIATALHVPLTLLLVGIVLRGSAFVFRQYGAGEESSRRSRLPGDEESLGWGWGRVFAIASTVSPVLLGIIVGALTSREYPLADGLPRGSFLWAWVGPFPVLVGLFTLSLFAFLAAVFLANEAHSPALADDFRTRALAAAAVTAVLGVAAAVVAAVAAGPAAAPFAHRLIGSWWSAPLLGATALATAGAIGALVRHRFRLARLLAIAVVSGVVLGWGAARYPLLLAPDLTVHNAAAPVATLRLLLPALGAGAVLLVPSLYWLLRVFKSRS